MAGGINRSRQAQCLHLYHCYLQCYETLNYQDFFLFVHFLFLKEACRHLLHQDLDVCFLLECLTPVHTNSGPELCPSFSVVH